MRPFSRTVAASAVALALVLAVGPAGAAEGSTGSMLVEIRPEARCTLADAATPGLSERLRILNKGVGRYAYIAVTFGPDAREATYRLRLS